MRILLSFTCALLTSAASLTAGVNPRQAFERIPAWFEPAASGQAYVSRTASVVLTVESRGAVLQAPSERLRLTFAGAQKSARVEGIQKQDAITNYFVGNRRDQWRRDVPHFERVAVRDVYRGVDVIYYANNKTLEYDFVLAPGADARQIRLRYETRDKLALTPEGDLLLAGGLRQHAPVSYQERDGQRVPVTSRYRLQGKGEVSIEVGNYDKSLPLVIDPVLAWAGYMGGDQVDVINGAVAYPDGSYYVVGAAASTAGAIFDFPLDTTPYQGELKTSRDAFVARVVPTAGGGWRMRYFSYIGGDGDDEAVAVVLAGDKLAITGNTWSSNWPLGGNAFQTNRAADDDGVSEGDAFVVLFNPTKDGDESLTYSSYYGGPKTETAQAIAVLPNGNLAITGYTTSGTLNGATIDVVLQPSNRGGVDSFVAVVNPNTDAASALIFSTFFGGNSTDLATSVTADSKGMVYIAGTTMSTDLPMAGNSYLPYANSIGDGFVAKLDPTKTGFDSLVYATYFGGSELDSIQAAAIDPQDRLWLAGYTFSDDMPVSPGAYQTSRRGGVDTFLALLDITKSGAAFVPYFTYFGGRGTDVTYALLVNPADGTLTMAGYTTSADFPVKGMTDYTQPTIKQSESFVSRLDPSKTGDSALVWSTMFGGSGMDVANAVAVGADGLPFVAGFTGSSDLTVVDTPGKVNKQGYYTGFFYRLKP
jgi:hypothetical protein